MTSDDHSPFTHHLSLVMRGDYGTTNLSEEPHDIWIVAETKDGALTPLTRELVYGGARGGRYDGLLRQGRAARMGVNDMAGECIRSGPIASYVADDDRLKLAKVLNLRRVATNWLKVLSDLFAAQAPEFVLFGATPLGEALLRDWRSALARPDHARG